MNDSIPLLAAERDCLSAQAHYRAALAAMPPGTLPEGLSFGRAVEAARRHPDARAGIAAGDAILWRVVLDDDRAIRTVLNEALGRLGHEVKTTGHAATLWKWVADGEGDVVITDVVMPDENGLDLIPRIRKIRPELRIIVMSAQNTLLTAVKATERGAFEYQIGRAHV